MKRMRWKGLALILVLASSLLLSQCCSTEDSGTDEGKGLLSWVPADTPYVIASTDQVPRPVVDHYFQRFGPMYPQIIAQAKASMAKDPSFKDTPGGKVLTAFLDEFGPNMSPEGLAKLGMTVQPHYAFYGQGFLPVARMTVADGKVFEATIKRVLAKAGVKVPRMKLGEYEYWSIEEDDVVFAFGIVGKQFVATMAPKKLVAKYLNRVFTKTKPANSLAKSGALATVQKEYKFTGYGVGYVDVKRLVETFTGGATGLDKELLALAKDEIPPLSPVCQKEIRGIAAKAPRLIYGVTELGTKKVTQSLFIELEPGLAKDLAALAAPVPGLSGAPVPGILANLGLGIDLAKTMGFLQKSTAAAQAAPYKCEHLLELNESLGEMNQKLAMAPIPPIVMQIKGLRLQVLEAKMEGGGMPKDVKAAAAITTQNPTMLLNMLKGFVPPLAAMQVAADGKPVALPPMPQLAMVQQPKVAMKGQNLVVTVGTGMDAQIPKLLGGKAVTPQPLFVLGYDYGSFMNIMQGFTGSMSAMMPPEEQAELKRSMELNKKLAQYMGYTTQAIYLETRGVRFEQVMEMK